MARDKSVPVEYRVALGQIKRALGKDVVSKEELGKWAKDAAKQNKISDVKQFTKFVETQIPFSVRVGKKISEKEIDEKYSKSQGYKNTQNAINTLVSSLQKNSNLSKSIQKELGSGYGKDFDKMGKLISEVSDIFNQIELDLDSSN